MRQLRIGNSAAGLVRCGVDKSLVPGTKAPVPTVLYLGRLKAYKRVDRLIAEFAKVRRSLPNAVLRIAGNGDSRPALEHLVERLNLQEAVFFEGFVDDDRKRELLQSAWVTVTLSEMEGWGIGAIEGNACGAPAIAYDVPGLREAIAHDRSGLIIPDGGDAASAILAVLSDPALRSRLERGALERAQEFSWDRTAREMLFEIMRAIMGLEFRVVDLDVRWTFFGATAEAFASGVFDTRYIRS